MNKRITAWFATAMTLILLSDYFVILASSAHWGFGSKGKSKCGMIHHTRNGKIYGKAGQIGTLLSSKRCGSRDLSVIRHYLYFCCACSCC